MSQVTTHILDTSIGRPASGVKVNFLQSNDGEWALMGNGVTDNDGRISSLIGPEVILEPGKYRLEFMLEPYFLQQGVSSFYPEASIVFMIRDGSHYHVPLLLSPFGYSTYRGS